MMAPVTGPQLHAARALLGWSRRTLAEKSGLTLELIQALEGSLHPSQVSGEASAILAGIFEAASVAFHCEPDMGVSAPYPRSLEGEQILGLENRMADRDTGGEISPRRGMERMRQANDENELRKLKARKPL